MSPCSPGAEDGLRECPRCGRRGRPVTDKTVAAILRPDAAPRLLAVARQFCRTPTCEVLYYGADGRIAVKADASVRVGIKESVDPVPLCYCFGFDRSHIVRDLSTTGRSTIAEWIAAEVRAGRCDCETKNPSGRCCLVEVRQAAQAAASSAAPGPQAGAPKRSGTRAG